MLGGFSVVDEIHNMWEEVQCRAKVDDSQTRESGDPERGNVGIGTPFWRRVEAVRRKGEHGEKRAV